MNAHLNANRRNDRAFAATLAAMATALCLLPLAGEFGRSTSTAQQAAPATATVTVLEPVVITSQRAARQARLAQDSRDDRSATPKI